MPFMHPRNKKSRSSQIPSLLGRGGQKVVLKTESGLKSLRNEGERLHGAALVIVLTFLVVITGLVVAFLSSVTNEATATSASAATPPHIRNCSTTWRPGSSARAGGASAGCTVRSS